MKARLTAHLPNGPEWVYEIKFDGVRALAIRDGGMVKLLSRSAGDFGTKYPLIMAALVRMPAAKAVLDGEVVALDPRGRPDFQLL